MGRLFAYEDPPAVAGCGDTREGRFFGFGRVACSGAGGEDAISVDMTLTLRPYKDGR